MKLCAQPIASQPCMRGGVHDGVHGGVHGGVQGGVHRGVHRGVCGGVQEGVRAQPADYYVREAFRGTEAVLLQS